MVSGQNPYFQDEISIEAKLGGARGTKGCPTIAARSQVESAETLWRDDADEKYSLYAMAKVIENRKKICVWGSIKK